MIHRNGGAHKPKLMNVTRFIGERGITMRQTGYRSKIHIRKLIMDWETTMAKNGTGRGRG